MHRHASWESLWQAEAPETARCFAYTARGFSLLSDARWLPGEWLVFGCETAALRDRFAAEQRVRLPMRVIQLRLNRNNVVAAAMLEAKRHIGYIKGR